MNGMKRVLIVDDDVAVTNYLMVFLMQTERFDPEVVNDSSMVPEILGREPFDLMLLDMDMPAVSGIDILRSVHESGGRPPVIVLTGVSDIELAVKAMKLGAFDYLTKPVDDDMLLATMDRALEHLALSRTISGLSRDLSRDDLENKDAFASFVSSDPMMVRLFHQAERLAAGDFSVFIHGEHGTGKEALARAMHQASPRGKGPFVAVDAAAVPPGDMAAELFGRVRDWSGRQPDRPGFLEMAAGGTLFLNSIEHLTPPVQVRLRRVIQNGEFYRESSAEICRIDVRLIASTTADLTGEEYRESFSRDLLYHLLVNSIELPPLREHPEDIPLLAEHFARREAERLGRPFKSVSEELTRMLSGHVFPGNVEELEAIVSSCVVSAEAGRELGPECLPPYMLDRMTGEGVRPAFRPRPLRDVIHDHVMSTLDYFGNDAKLAAGGLGISESELSDIADGATSDRSPSPPG